jgi:hypothetical protein
MRLSDADARRQTKVISPNRHILNSILPCHDADIPAGYPRSRRLCETWEGNLSGCSLKTAYHAMSASFTYHGAFRSEAITTDVARNHSQVSQNRRDPGQPAVKGF